ncbi:MAG: ExbD/TolR family protein [Phycisphaerales bacterium JB040]
MNGGGFRNRSPLAAHGVGHGIGFGPNLTPMVDVVMVILIFFMAAASFLGPEWFLRAGLAPAPPQGQAQSDWSGALPEVRLRVILDTLGDQPVASFEGGDPRPLNEFLTTFQSAAPGLLAGDSGRALTIAPTDRVAWDAVILLHEAALEAGFGRVVLE